MLTRHSSVRSARKCSIVLTLSCRSTYGSIKEWSRSNVLCVLTRAVARTTSMLIWCAIHKTSRSCARTVARLTSRGRHYDGMFGATGTARCSSAPSEFIYMFLVHKGLYFFIAVQVVQPIWNAQARQLLTWSTKFLKIHFGMEWVDLLTVTVA